MPWLRLDDRFATHPKIAALNDRHFRVWIRTLLYCASHQTSGVIPPAAEVRGLTDAARKTFIKLGLIDRDRKGVDNVHDWRVYNPSDPTAAERASRYRHAHKRDENVTASRQRHGKNRDATVTSRARQPARPVPSPTTSSKGRPSPRPATPNGLPDEHLINKLLKTIGKHADAGTPQIIRTLAAGLPQAALARVTESIQTANPKNRAAYAVAALKSETEPDFQGDEPD